MSVIWHDLECGSYGEDLQLWHSLAAEYGDPVLELGAGTGRVTLALARAGHDVTALDSDAELLGELERRAHGLSVVAVHADARDFVLDRSYRLCVVPMQTIQLLGGRGGRLACLGSVRRHLVAGGAAAIALADTLELYTVADGFPAPLPDISERDGVVYSSQPTAVRADRFGFVLERRRETISAAGERVVVDDAIRLDHVTADELEEEAVQAGFRIGGREAIAATRDYSGSVVVMLGA